MSTKNPGVVAVTDMKTAGAIVWWRLSGVTDPEKLAAAWKEAGLVEALLPGLPTLFVAAGRAVSALAEKHRLVRPIKDGWVVKEETVDRDINDLAYSTALKVVGVKSEGVESLTVEPMNTPLHQEFVKALERTKRELTIYDISGFLTRLVCRSNAVTLRDTGGVYFIPRDSLDVFRKAVGAIKSVSSHEVFEVPALQTAEAVHAILDAVASEADKVCTQIETELDVKDLGPRALRTRASRAEEMKRKIEVYEQLLGAKLPELQTRIEALKAGIVEATLVAAATDNAEDAA